MRKSYHCSFIALRSWLLRLPVRSDFQSTASTLADRADQSRPPLVREPMESITWLRSRNADAVDPAPRAFDAGAVCRNGDVRVGIVGSVGKAGVALMPTVAAE